MKQSRLEWKRAQKVRWITEGFKAARDQAAAICRDTAEQIDRRPELARATGVRPSEPVRRLRQAAQMISDMPRPAALPKHFDLDEPECRKEANVDRAE